MLSKAKQATVVLSGEVQYVGLRAEMEELLARHGFPGFVYNDTKDGTLKVVCEGDEAEIRQLIAEISAGRPEVRVSLKEGVVLPKPAGRVVIGVEREIFERLDLGVERLGSMDAKLNRLESMDTKLESMDGTLKDIKGLLKKLAEK
ncbi:MAG: acylphosphatase [Euryarchaeota archaeon]|nr:acylphosphatase [Euryarchaeota archaeon]